LDRLPLDLVLFELAKVQLPALDSWSQQAPRDLESLIRGSFVHELLRHYLTQAPVPAHRRILSKLILGEHNYRSVTEHSLAHHVRLCRMCGVDI
jgi:hypothetical protein